MNYQKSQKPELPRIEAAVPVLAECLDICSQFLSMLCACLMCKNHACAHLLSEFFIWNANNAHIFDQRMLEENIFNLTRRCGRRATEVSRKVSIVRGRRLLQCHVPMFSPPRMIVSLMRPTIVQYPSSSMMARSPVFIHPSGVTT